jgi:ribokinase
MPAMPVEMQDTTAAADCFVGVIAAALGRRTPFPDALRRAAVAAALSAREVGAKSSLPRRPEIDAALCDAPPTSRQEEVPD